MNKVYIRYNPIANVDYILLLSLYTLADYDTETRTYSIMSYQSQSRLASLLNISQSKVQRFFANHDYDDYLTIDKKNRQIRLLNDFRKAKNVSYVSLTITQTQYLIDTNNNLLVKYYLYLLYYCGKCRSKRIDTTAKQFLEATGYATNSNDTLSRIACINSQLEHDGLITIERFVDANGRSRNLYSIKDFAIL